MEVKRLETELAVVKKAAVGSLKHIEESFPLLCCARYWAWLGVATITGALAKSESPARARSRAPNCWRRLKQSLKSIGVDMAALGFT